MKQSLRLLQLLRMLPRRKGNNHSTVSALSTHFNTTQRTIYRDIQILQEAGYAVQNDRNGYYLMTSDQNAPVDLTSCELLSLVCASRWAQEAVPGAFQDDLEDIINKLAAACGTREALEITLDRSDGISIQPHFTDGQAAISNMSTALKARREGRKLRGEYHIPDRDEILERVMHPYEVVCRGQAHYLVAWCELRGELRTFRLDRFRNLHILNEDAQIPEDYDLARHFSGAWEVVGGRAQEVVMHVKGKMARRLQALIVHPSQQVTTLADGMLELRFKVAITEELVNWVMSLGAEGLVIQPGTLRQQVLAKVRKIVANYPDD